MADINDKKNVILILGVLFAFIGVPLIAVMIFNLIEEGANGNTGLILLVGIIIAIAGGVAALILYLKIGEWYQEESSGQYYGGPFGPPHQHYPPPGPPQQYYPPPGPPQQPLYHPPPQQYPSLYPASQYPPQPSFKEQKVRIVAEETDPARIIAAPPFQSKNGMWFKAIPPGEFLMGEPYDPVTRIPMHMVRLTKPFAIGVFPVTRGEWKSVMGTEPSYFKGDWQCPVESLTWNDCQNFIHQLNLREPGAEYRLLTEAEWEYACRAGSKGKFYFGDNENDLNYYAWYRSNSGRMTHPVGMKRPNPWGLYDMVGNVREWCEDGFKSYSLTGESAVDPVCPSMDRRHVLRGGSFNEGASCCYSGDRAHALDTENYNSFGLRLARSIGRE